MKHVRFQLAFASSDQPEVLGRVQYKTRAEAEEDAASHRARHDGLASADVVRVVEMREVVRVKP